MFGLSGNAELFHAKAQRGGLHAKPCRGPASACDVCGGVLMRRVDDNEQAVRARLDDYHQKTQPILDLFRQKELVVVADGTKAPDEVQADIRRQLKPGK